MHVNTSGKTLAWKWSIFPFFQASFAAYTYFPRSVEKLGIFECAQWDVPASKSCGGTGKFIFIQDNATLNAHAQPKLGKMYKNKIFEQFLVGCFPRNGAPSKEFKKMNKSKIRC